MLSTLHHSSFRHGGLTAGVAVAALAVAGLLVPAAQGNELGETQSSQGCLTLDRLGGQNAIETSDLVARQAYPNGSTNFLVASARNPVDALPGGALGIGPILLTDGLNWNLDYLTGLTKAFILGGIGAVPGSAEMFLDEHGFQYDRIQGPDRNATATAIADYWTHVNGQPTYVYVTRNAGSGSPDAVAASGVRNGPILTFTNQASLLAAAAKIKELKPSGGVVVLGGTGVVSNAEAVTLAGGLPLHRLSGADRYETSWAIANWVLQSKTRSHVYLASGHALKDAMVAGAFNDGVILLSPPDGSRIHDWATQINADGITVIGGLGVVSNSAANNAACGQAPGINQATVSKLLLPVGSFEFCASATWDATNSLGLLPSTPNAEDSCWVRPNPSIEQVTIRHQGDYNRDGFSDAIVYLSDPDGTAVFLVVYNPYDPAHPYVGYLWGGNGDWDFQVTNDPQPSFNLIAGGQIKQNLAVINTEGVPNVVAPVG